jgi:hypothetical protein
MSLMKYGLCLIALERFADAETALLEGQEILETALGPEHERTVEAISALIELYDAWHEAEPGKGYDAKAADWQAKLPAENSE